MRRMMLVALAGLLASCADKQPLVVKQFTLRDTVSDFGEDPMIRGEKLRRLHGAIGVKEQAQRLGQYYTVLWNDAEGAGSNHTVVFEYQQGATGSRIKRETREFPLRKFFHANTSGQTEFSIIGDNHKKNGRVLAWRMALLRDGREIASRKSYLWQ